eukprot:1151591-Pelagomonas_calceolata.AAC.3
MQDQQLAKTKQGWLGLAAYRQPVCNVVVQKKETLAVELFQHQVKKRDHIGANTVWTPMHKVQAERSISD